MEFLSRSFYFSFTKLLNSITNNLQLVSLLVGTPLRFNSLLVSGIIKRCYQCRSRGQLGSCRDPFRFNVSIDIENEPGVTAIPCASGWCGKVLEGESSTFKADGEFVSCSVIEVLINQFVF